MSDSVQPHGQQPTVGVGCCPSTGFSRQEHWSGLPFPSPVPVPRGSDISPRTQSILSSQGSESPKGTRVETCPAHSSAAQTLVPVFLLPYCPPPGLGKEPWLFWPWACSQVLSMTDAAIVTRAALTCDEVPAVAAACLGLEAAVGVRALI